MHIIALASVLSANRKKRGITQSDLAKYLGVSKAAVSKWETGQSYPDLLLLPEIASYFNLTIDELIGYKPQLNEKEIQKVYQELSKAFAEVPFEDVMQRCQEIIKKYYACFPLLSQMGLLFLNHAQMASEKEKQEEMIQQAKSLFQRVQAETDDIDLAKEAKVLEAFCCLVANDPKGTIALLEDVRKWELSGDALLASAYSMLGEVEKQKHVVQAAIYKSTADIFGNYGALLSGYMDDKERFEDYYQSFLLLNEAFHGEDLMPVVILGIILTGIQIYISHENISKAVEEAKKYIIILENLEEPLTVHGNQFFDLIQDWLHDSFGNSLPRNSQMIKNDLVKIITEGPIYDALKTDQHFRFMTDSLKTSLK